MYSAHPMLPTPLAIALGLCTLFVVTRRARQPAVDPLIAAAPPPRFLRYSSFMGPRRANDILLSTALRTPMLERSTVTGDVLDYRRSQLLWRGELVAPDVTNRVRAMAPELGRLLGVPPFPIGDVETQVTVSSGGDFFKRHDDNGSPETASRRISWVYYVHRMPRPFNGGELVMYGATTPDGQPGAYVVEPENDSLVVFPSECLHEVLPVATSVPCTATSVAVYGPSEARARRESSERKHDERSSSLHAMSPLDARVTVNGWIREAA